MPTVVIPTKRITDWASFHDVFAEIMGFPDFYGRNMDAWIDCMSSLDSPDDAMTKIHCLPHDVVALHLADVDDFKSRCREYTMPLSNVPRLLISGISKLATQLYLRFRSGTANRCSDKIRHEAGKPCDCSSMSVSSDLQWS